MSKIDLSDGSLDCVFIPLDDNDKVFWQEPASLKKMKQGDAMWTTSKVILGWRIDTTAKTMELPSHQVKRLLEILESIAPDQKSITTKDWHKVLGELCSMPIALPGLVGLFPLLQETFHHVDPTQPRLNLSKAMHSFLNDFWFLAKDVATRLTRITELVPDTAPDTIGARDAAGTGIGGIHFIPAPEGSITPYFGDSVSCCKFNISTC